MHDIGPLSVEPLADTARLLDRERSPVRPVAELPTPVQRYGPVEEPVHDAEAPQQPYGVGVHHEPGTDLGECGRLLVDGGRQPRAAQEGTGRLRSRG